MGLLRITRLAVASLLFLLCFAMNVGCNGFSSGNGNNGPSGTYSITGAVSPAANGSGATIKLSGAASATTTADGAGNYRFTGLANGSYTVSAAKTGFSVSPSSQPAIVKGANVAGVNFAASSSKTWSISGTINPSATGAGASVILSGAASASTIADASGKYTFSGLVNGSYEVTPSKTGFSFNPASQTPTVNNTNVTGMDFTQTSNCTSGNGTANFYVAIYGSDSWSGTLDCPNQSNTDGPFASIARAQQAVQSIRGSASQPITVMLREGTYYLALSPTSPGSLNFTANDSGTSATPITWENYPGETPVVSGGEPVSGSPGLGLIWNHVSGNLWQVQLPANTQPFEYLFYNGERRLRSRLQSSAGTGYYMSGGACHSTQTTQTVGISLCNLGTFLRVAAEVAPTGANANCPSVTSSDGTQSKCLDRFQYNASDPITTWINLNPPKGNPCHSTTSNKYPVGDIELYLFEAWTMELMRVSCVDTATHIIYFTAPTGGNGLQYNFFGPTAGHRYVVENTRDAFNQEQTAGQTGIWFVDRSTSPWTLNYLANDGEDPNSDSVVIPQVQPVSATGGSLISASQLNYVSFQGITFEVDNFIPPVSGFNNDENGESVLPAAIDCESCQNVTFDGVTVRHTSASGIQIASLLGNSGTPAANDVIQNSAFYDIGDSGIHIGHHPVGSDGPSHVVQFVTVQNNIIQGYSRVFAAGEGIAQGNGHDVTYLHNDIDDGYHAGISICLLGCPGSMSTANGFNIVSQYNHIWNIIQGITSDGGTLYYNVGMSGGSGTGNQILNNLVHDTTDSSIIDIRVHGSGYGGEGIYLDAQSAGVDVENNVVYHISSANAHVSLGPGAGEPANTFNNNILAYGRNGLFEEDFAWPQGCTSPSLRANITNNIFYFDRTEASRFYVIRGCEYSCGLAYNQFQNFQGNLYWRTDGGFSSDSQGFHLLTNPPSDPTTCSQPGYDNSLKLWTFLTFSQWQSGHAEGSAPAMNEDPGGTVTVNPGFGNTGEPSDFLLSSAPLPGFDSTKTNDTINQAGRSNPVIMPPTVPATFPTYSYANANF